MCDVAYVLWWERQEREHLALWQAAILAGAMGSTVEVPPLHNAQEEFDAMLAEAPKSRTEDPITAARKRVLGVA